MTNTGTFEERLAEGKRREAEVIDRLKMSFWSVIPATEAQDKYDKVDAWIRWKGVTYSVAIKARDRDYADLGIAIVRPFVDLPTLRQQWAVSGIPFDRDYESMCELYAIHTPSSLRIVTGHSAKVMCNKALFDLVERGIWKGKGYEIKQVRDRGASGYSSGQTRLICYMSLDHLTELELP